MMCDYCNSDSDKCCIFIDPLDNLWYLDIETDQWDDYDDGWIRMREYINYCPYCGRDLRKTNKGENNIED